MLSQPNGVKIVGYLFGDEFHLRVESEEGYTIILNEQTGTIEYAILENKRLVPSGMIVGAVSLAYLERINFPKQLSDREFKIAEFREKSPDILHDSEFMIRSGETKIETQALVGTKKVFAACVEFQSEESPPTKWSTGTYSPSGFDSRLFSSDPSGISMTNYFRSNSYNQFWPVGYTYPSWISLPNTASWYKENESWRKVIEDAMDGIRSIDGSFDFTQYANNSDLDIILIWAGTSETWATFFWPKKGTAGVNKYGVRVRYYNVVNERYSSGGENTGIGTFCHEYGHMTGSPDLYDYSSFQNRPLGYYCLMGMSSPATNFCGYIKWRVYGWVEPLEIFSGNYSVDALGLSAASNPKLYKISINPPKEYLLLENRYNGADPDYENYGYRRSGLLMTHLDENYPPAVGLPSYTFYGVEAIAPGLDPTITSLTQYSQYWSKMVFSADFGYTRLEPKYPDNMPPGVYLTLTTDDDTENVIYRNTQGHTISTDIYITSISDSGFTMNFTVSKSFHTLTISTNLGGTTEPSPGSHDYGEGMKVKVTAIPDDYFYFSHWSGDTTGESNPITVIMDSNKSISVNFNKVYPPLSLKGKKALNRSLLFAEYINVLNWQPNPNNVNIAKYRIYMVEEESQNSMAKSQVSGSELRPGTLGKGRVFWPERNLRNEEDKVLLVELDADTFEYWHRKVEKDKTYTYALTAVNDKGREGEPTHIIVH